MAKFSSPLARWWRMKRMQRVFRRQFRHYHDACDVLVVSFPKSGRTWHRVAFGHHLATRHGQPLQTSPHTLALTRAIGGPVVHYDHNGTDFSAFLKGDDPLVASPLLWQDRKLMLMVRDPRDLIVSAYHHMVERYGFYEGSLSAFLRDPATGIEKVLIAYNRWWDQRGRAAAFEVVAYEAMHRNAADVVARTVRFCGYGEPTPEELQATLAFAAFDNMRRLEAENFFDDASMKRKRGGGAKVRSGKVGGFRDALSAEDIAYAETVTARIGNPFAGIIAGRTGG